MQGHRQQGAADPGSGRGTVRPAIADRMRAAWAPGWGRTVLLRRSAALVLTVAAGALLLRGTPDEGTEPVVVAAADLTPGTSVGDEDVRRVDRPVGTSPSGALTDTDAALQRTVAAPVRAGETLTDVRFIGPSLARSATGVEDARVVTVRLADPALAEVLGEGDVVDIIAGRSERARSAAAQDPTGGGARSGEDPTNREADERATESVRGVDAPEGSVLAEHAPVVLVPPAPETRSAGGRVALIALPAEEAARVATAALDRAVTVAVH